MLQFIAVGRMVKDVELKGAEGTVGVFTLATTIPEKDEEGKRKTEFLNCVCFGKTAENLAKYTQKGDLISVKGYPKTEKYEKDNQVHYTIKFYIQNIEYLVTKHREQEEPVTDYSLPATLEQAEKVPVTNCTEEEQTVINSFVDNI